MNLHRWPKILISVVGEMKSLELRENVVKNLKEDLQKVCSLFTPIPGGILVLFAPF